MNTYKAIILGDSFNNTLGLIRSLGEQKIPLTLILVGEEDKLYVCKSRYLKKDNIFKCQNISDSLPILQKIADGTHRQVILCTNDKAAAFIDEHEEQLYQNYITPMSGRHLKAYMDKECQCKLADECGFDIPQSTIYHRTEKFSTQISYPLLLKPLTSIEGEKSDIHICYSHNDVKTALQATSHCSDFLVQEYVDKEYEINLIGISTEWGVLIPGGIKKIRHYPTIYSPCSFGIYQAINQFNIDTKPIQRFLTQVGYKGLFSVELLHKGTKNYFMEVNFRNDGLAYVVTAAGTNLPAIYMQFKGLPQQTKVRSTYMMDLSIDYCHVKDKNISFKEWICDFYKTGCQLNFNKKDMAPTLYYYFNKFRRFFR